MTDIVETARTRASSYRMGGPSSEHTAALLDELADTIEALRAEVARFRGFETANRLNAAQVAAQRAENEKLRSALERARTLLGNMALENEGATFWRWPIHHEPLRADARNLLPIIDAALEENS